MQIPMQIFSRLLLHLKFKYLLNENREIRDVSYIDIQVFLDPYFEPKDMPNFQLHIVVFPFEQVFLVHYHNYQLYDQIDDYSWRNPIQYT